MSQEKASEVDKGQVRFGGLLELYIKINGMWNFKQPFWIFDSVSLWMDYGLNFLNILKSLKGFATHFNKSLPQIHLFLQETCSNCGLETPKRWNNNIGVSSSYS